MTIVSDTAVAARALVLSKDPVALRLLLESLTSFAIRLQVCTDSFAAIGLLSREKVEAFVGDLEQAEEVSLVLTQLRLSRANRTAVTFAIGASSGPPATVALHGSTFVLQRPLSVESIRSTFRAAFGMVVRERRRYFRCPTQVPALLQGQQSEVSCLTLNISEGGLAVRPALAGDQEFSTVQFTLPGVGQFFSETKVCWRGKIGEVGLEFVSFPRKPELQEWLGRKLEESLPDSVAQLFRRTEQPKSIP